MVQDVHDHDQAAAVGAIVDQAHTADLDKTGVRLHEQEGRHGQEEVVNDSDAAMNARAHGGSGGNGRHGVGDENSAAQHTVRQDRRARRDTRVHHGHKQHAAVAAQQQRMARYTLMQDPVSMPFVDEATPLNHFKQNTDRGQRILISTYHDEKEGWGSNEVLGDGREDDADGG